MPPDELRAAIVQDAATGRVLMLAWMDDEAERLTRETGEAWFWSRSRERALAQGRDLRQHARGRGAARRLRRRRAARARAPGRPGVPHRHRLVLRAGALADDRASAQPSGPRARTRRSCSTRASARARARSGRRRSRSTVAALDESDERVVEEAADLVYHLYVLLAARGLDIAQVEDELARR